MRVSKHSVPPEGYHFTVEEGVRLTAPSFEILYQRISEYRMRRGLPPGDPQRDVDQYVCAKWPHACHPEPHEGPPVSDRGIALSRRVASWAADKVQQMPAGGYELVELKEAARRADICRQCPFNRSWKVGCSPCNATTESLLSTVRRLKATGIDRSLMGCEVGGTDNATGIWLPDAVMRATDDERDRLPPGCWKLKL